MKFFSIQKRQTPTHPSNLALRLLALLILLLPLGISTARAQTNYVFYNGTYGFIYNNDGSVSVKTAIDESCIWRANNTLGGTSRNIRSYIDDTKYLRGASNNITLGGSNDEWRGNGTYLQWRSGSSYYVKYNGTSFVNNSTQNSGERFYYYTVSIINATTPTFDISYPTADAYVGNVGGTMSISASVNGNYRPKYYTVNNNRYYLDGGTTYSNSAPSQVSQYKYTYELVGECVDYATISGSTVTYTEDAGHDVIAQVKVTAKPQGYDVVVGEGICSFVLRSTTIAAPTITRIEGTNQYQITTTSQGASIQYTIDGTDINEWASNGAAYTEPITVTTNGAVIKAKAVREGRVSEQTQYTVSDVLLDPPTITISDAGVVTITNPNTFASSATIRYTTDGSDPTSLSSPFSSHTASNMQTIKAIVTANGYVTSAVASKQYRVASGISDGKVILNDYEDHNWSYYLPNGGVGDNYDYPSRLCSPYPRNVKITYHGNGPMYIGADGDTTTSTGSSVAVSQYESDSIFIYYKTLERDANNRFPYELIPNPFSKRPIYTSDATTKWRGFYGWRIKRITNGKVYDNGTERSTGYIFTTEYQQLAFQPTDNAKTNANNATSMEVEFEAVWARAYRVGCNANAVSTNLSSGDLKATSYERNFVVVNSGTSGAGINNASQKPVTVMMVEPDGSSDYRTNSRYIATASTNIIAQNTLKIEWCNVRAQYISANAKDMILGRGITYNSGNSSYGTLGTTNCASYVSGIGALDNTTGTNYTNEINHKFRIESGIYGDLNFTSRAGNGLRGYASGLIYQYCIVGNDYERASKDGLTSDNARLHIKNHISQGVGGNGATFSNSNHNNAGRKTFDLVIKSGYVGSNYDNDINGTSWDANYEQVVYIGVSTSNRTPGYRSLTLEGGNISGISGGVDRWGSTSTTTKEYNMNRPSVYIRMKGSSDYPIVRGPIYAGAANAPTYGSRTVIATGGIIKGWLAGGCNGNDSQEGKNFGPSYIYVGGNASVNSNNKSTTFGAGGAIGGMVFAAGSGRSDNASSGRIEYGTHLTIADNAYIERNAFGGGNYGFSVDSTKIFITGGRVHGSVFGGANLRGGNKVNIVMNGGLIEGGLYGGSNQNGTISSNVTMQINGGQVGTSTTPANIHGGGYGASTIVSGNVDVTLGTKSGEVDVTYTTSGDAVIYGDVYGGSALGQVNATPTTDRNGNITGYTYTNNTETNVTLNAGTIYGSLYGGGLGNNTTAADVYGPVQVTVNGGSVLKTDANGANGSGGVYGCNNINGAPQGNVSVDIYGTDPAPAEGEYALFSVYGGGNKADYNDSPAVTIHNCNNSIEYVYGGGNAAAVSGTIVTIYGGNKIGNVFGGGNGISGTAANITGDVGTYVMIYGGTIGNVFGGSNSLGTIEGEILVKVSPEAEDTYCPINIDNLYGGGNMAPSQAGRLTISCDSYSTNQFHIGNVYGGANQADITGNIELNITSGYIDNVFGGNNTSGSINGTITVNIEETDQGCGMEVGNVYGGGNKAAYAAPDATKDFPKVNLIKGTILHDVFGGGLGSSAEVTGNPQVNMTGGLVGGTLYGGGSAAPVTGNPYVKMNVTTHSGSGEAKSENWWDVKGYVFGGGLGESAVVTGNTQVEILGTSRIGKNVYGGGNGGAVTGNTDVTIGQ